MSAKKFPTFAALGGLGVTAATVYLFDPEHGRKRRTALAKTGRRFVSAVEEEAARSWKDTAHQLQGVIARVSRLRDETASDETITERIRSRMGRVVSHPHRIKVASDHGVVTLWGAILKSEVNELLHTVKRVPGVDDVQNHLEVTESEEFALGTDAKEKFMSWSPTKRLLASTAGIAMAVYGLKKKNSFGKMMSLLGVGLIARSSMKKSVASTLALTEESPGFEIEETINIQAPLSDVFDFWVNPENYPQAFSHIASVERMGENLYRWSMTGPAGIPIGWEGVITKIVPNTLVGWKSLPGSLVGNFGIARFDPNYDGSTRLQIRMYYRPPAGILGRFAAGLLGSDARTVLHQDLVRLKELFERGEVVTQRQKNAQEQAELLKMATT
jgi:uncharacterized membrane protein